MGDIRQRTDTDCKQEEIEEGKLIRREQLDDLQPDGDLQPDDDLHWHTWTGLVAELHGTEL